MLLDHQMYRFKKHNCQTVTATEVYLINLYRKTDSEKSSSLDFPCALDFNLWLNTQLKLVKIMLYIYSYWDKTTVTTMSWG